MEYICSCILIGKLPITLEEIKRPLCDTCTRTDCTNPIHFTNVSILGISEKHRCFVTTNSDPSFVIECKGFTDKIQEYEEYEEYEDEQ